MKRNKIRQVIAIESTDASDFAARYNEAMREHHGDIVEEKTTVSDGVFAALLFYTFTEEVVETVRDEYELAGITYKCKHCPFPEDPKDGRVKRMYCRYSEFGETHKYDPACEVFYRALKQGEIKPLKDYERR